MVDKQDDVVEEDAEGAHCPPPLRRAASHALGHEASLVPALLSVLRLLQWLLLARRGPCARTAGRQRSFCVTVVVGVVGAGLTHLGWH